MDDEYISLRAAGLKRQPRRIDPFKVWVWGGVVLLILMEFAAFVFGAMRGATWLARKL